MTVASWTARTIEPRGSLRTPFHTLFRPTVDASKLVRIGTRAGARSGHLNVYIDPKCEVFKVGRARAEIVASLAC